MSNPRFKAIERLIAEYREACDQSGSQMFIDDALIADVLLEVHAPSDFARLPTTEDYWWRWCPRREQPDGKLQDAHWELHLVSLGKHGDGIGRAYDDPMGFELDPGIYLPLVTPPAPPAELRGTSKGSSS
jgi:hypothetical protein